MNSPPLKPTIVKEEVKLENIGVRCRFVGVTGRRISMRIAICDDEIGFLEEVKHKIYEYSNSHNWESVIEVFHSGEELIKFNEQFDLIILDYQMNGLTGLETAEQLRQGKNALSCIIFLTSYPEIAIPAYSVDTYRFVVKNTLYSGLFKALDEFRTIQRLDYDISIKSEGEFVTLNTSDIVFIEAQNKEIYIHLQNQNVLVTKTKLICLYQRLPHSHFFKCHKSYIVNFRYISNRSCNEIHLRGIVNSIPVSRNYKQAFTEKYNIYLKEY